MATLNTVMRANAVSCIGFGLTFLLLPSSVILFLSADMPVPETVLLCLGVGLLLNGLHLIWASLKPTPSKLLVLYFSIGDFIWVLVSIGLLFLGIWITSTEGMIVAAAVAAVVGLFGLFQLRARTAMGA